MNVTFHHPPTKTANPFRDFDPTNRAHYPDGTGVYIYGLRLNIVEDDMKTETQLYTENNVPLNAHENWKFVPLYTGIAHAYKANNKANAGEGLRDRLRQHYREERIDGQSEKEMFDFSLNKYSLTDLIDRYNDMGYYDSFLGKHGKLKKIYSIPHLIWWQNLVFYLLRYGVNPLIAILDSKQFKTIKPGGDFDGYIIPNYPRITADINSIRDKIIATKERFNDHFYYVYAQFKDINHNLTQEPPHISNMELPALWQPVGINPDEHLLNGIEHATKQALKGIGINTTAKSDRKTNETINIDLQNIINELVNVTGLPLPLILAYTPMP